MARVAIVDDDPDIVSLIKEVLFDAGHEVIACSPPHEVAGYLQQEVPDLIIIDGWLATPKTGWNIIEHLQNDPQTKDIPIIVCSGAADQLELRREWLTERNIGILPKPFDIAELDCLVRRKLET